MWSFHDLTRLFFHDGGMKIYVPFIHKQGFQILNDNENFLSKLLQICKISFCWITFFWSSKQWNLSNIMHNATIFKERKITKNSFLLHSACFSNIFAHLPTYLDTTTAVHKYCTQVFTTLANTMSTICSIIIIVLRESNANHIITLFSSFLLFKFSLI